MDEDDERAIELSAIAAIYPELILDAANPYSASLEIAVTPEKPLKIYFQSSSDGLPPVLPTPSTQGIKSATETLGPPSLERAAQIDVHELAHLPPITLSIALPIAYPTIQPPTTEVSVTPCWVPQDVLESLSNDCRRLWEDIGRDQVVYTYIDHIQQAAEQAFGLATTNSFKLSSDLKLALLDFDLKSRKDHFERETFDCGICLEPKKGKDCHRLLLCGHVFCVVCLQDFYNNCITEGDIDNVKCLSPSCGKDISVETTPGKRRKLDQTLNPSELLQIPLTTEQVQRYVRLKRKKKLEADKNTIYCPRQWCQGAARSKKHPKPTDLLLDFVSSESETEQPVQESKKKKQKPENIPMSERLCVCEDCNFAFCSVCKKGWHGELASCNPRRQAELNEEEKASLDYLQRFSTPCPTCSAPAQKSHGCNHMICFKCKSHFCYLCSSYLMPDNPYRHFNDLKSTCYMRLWELEAGDGIDAGIGFAGGAGNGVPWEPGEFESDSESESDASDADLGEFDGDDAVDWDDSDDDDEPAPDQRRPDRPHIEIVNFARHGANQRIELPEQPVVNVAPPPAPAPPRRRGRGQAANRQQVMQREPHRGQRAVPQPVVPVEAPLGLIRNAAPGQGNNIDIALQRFLRLAREDREDEWDSDEDDDIALPVAPRPNRGQMIRRRG